MADERFTFEQARLRLEEIATEVRKKDTSLEKSLDLLEEGVRLANICTELVDHTDLGATVSVPVPDAPDAPVADVPDVDRAGEGSVPDDDADGSAIESDGPAESDDDVDGSEDDSIGVDDLDEPSGE